MDTTESPVWSVGADRSREGVSYRYRIGCYSRADLRCRVKNRPNYFGRSLSGSTGKTKPEQRINSCRRCRPGSRRSSCGPPERNGHERRRDSAPSRWTRSRRAPRGSPRIAGLGDLYYRICYTVSRRTSRCTTPRRCRACRTARIRSACTNPPRRFTRKPAPSRFRRMRLPRSSSPASRRPSCRSGRLSSRTPHLTRPIFPSFSRK
jgi:hypothetical protein